MKLSVLFSLSLLLSPNFVFSQTDEQFKSVLTFNSDNDAFVFWENKDRYYTYGIGVSLSFRSEKFLGLEKWFVDKESFFLNAGMRMEGYTPTNKVVTAQQIEGDSMVVFDRPFAGLLYGTLESTYNFKRSYFRTGILLGIMGPSSGAGRLQRWIHDNVTQDGVFDGWRFELPDQILLNLSGTYVYDFTPQASWLGFYGYWQARLGNLYIDTTPKLGLRIGRFNDINKTAVFGNGLLAGRSDFELYLHSSFSTTLAFFDGTAQGRLFGPQYEYALDDINSLYFAMSHGIYFSYRRIILGFDHFFTYGKVLADQRHIYARLEFRYRF